MSKLLYRLTIIYLLLIILEISLFAESIDLEQCIYAALNKAYDLDSAKLKLENSLDQRTVDLLDFLPQTALYSNAKQDIEGNRYGTSGIVVSGDLYLWDTRWNEYKNSNLTYRSQQIEFALARKDKIIWIIELYSNILLLHTELDNYLHSKELYLSEVEFIRQLMTVGKRSEFDLVSAQLEIQNIEIEIEKISNEVQQKKHQLSLETGLEMEKMTELDEIEIPSLQNMTFIKVSEFPEYRQQELFNNQYRNQRNMSRNNLFPDLYLNGYYEWKNAKYWEDSNKIYDYEGNFISRDATQDYWEVSLNIYYPLGNLIRNVYDYRIASRELIIQENKTKIIENELELKIRNLEANLDLKKKEIDLQRDRFILSERKFELARERFRSGLISFLDYSSSVEEKNAAQLGLKRIQFEFLSTYLEWQRLTGQDLLHKYN